MLGPSGLRVGPRRFAVPFGQGLTSVPGGGTALGRSAPRNIGLSNLSKE